MRRPLLFWLCLLMALSPLTAQAQPACPGALPSRMTVNQPGKVIARNGVNARERPSAASARVMGLPEGSAFTVIDGPVCAEGIAWWEIRFEGRTGWVAEGSGGDYWLQSLAPNLREVRLEDVTFAYDRAVASGAYGGYTAEQRLSDSLTLPNGIGFGFERYVGGDAAFLMLYPARDYETLNPGAISGLDAALRSRTAAVNPDPRWFPYTGASVRVMGRARYFDFQSGAGVRYLMYYQPETPEAVTRDALFYVFLGLTDDGQRFVQGFFPVRVLIFPEQPPESFDVRSVSAFDAYLDDIAFLVNNAGSDAFDPLLNTLDTMLNTLRVRPQPPENARLVAYDNVRFTLDMALARGGSGERVPAVDPASPLPFWLKTPEHVRFRIDGLPGFGELPQLAVYPAQAYNLRFAGAIDELQAYLRAGNATADPPLRLPVASARRVFVAQPTLLDFTGGGGVRFLAYLSDATEYITRDRIVYVFVGLTSDGRSFVQAIIPVMAAVYPAARPADFNYEQFVAGYSDYLTAARRDLNTAAGRSFTPRLDQLDALIGSLRID